MKNQKKDENKKSIQDKISTLKYNCSGEAHLIVDNKKCAKCKEKTCTFICPADVYSVDNQTNETIVQYENCMECGACRIACPKGAINWNYPNDNCGIIYKNS